MRKIISALFLLVSLATAHAQAPPAVPALPDTERRTSYSISASTCACAVNFALYGDSTDFNAWVEVFINGVRVNYNDATYGWTITSPTGPLATIPRPITNAVLTFTNAQTGTIQIVGARRPRRVSQFSENRGVAARDLNQVLTDIIAQNREIWDKTNDVTGRAIIGLPGETMTTLPPVATRAGAYLAFDGAGNPIAATGGVGSGNVVGAAPSVSGHVPAYSGTGGNTVADSGYFPVQPITCSASQWVNLISSGGVASCAQPAFSNISGQATLAQLPPIADQTTLCNVSGGSAVPTACSKTQITTQINQATASLSGAAPPWPNNTTTFLRGDGTYATPASQAMTLLATLTASTSASLNDSVACGGSNCLTSTYSSYELVFSNVIPATNGASPQLLIHSGGAYKATGYLNAGSAAIPGSGVVIQTSLSTTSIQLSFNSATDATNNPKNATPGLSGIVRLFNPSAAQITPVQYDMSYIFGAGTNVVRVSGMGLWNTSGAIDGFQFLFNTGNITSGTIKIYGVQ